VVIYLTISQENGKKEAQLDVLLDPYFFNRQLTFPEIVPALTVGKTKAHA